MNGIRSVTLAMALTAVLAGSAEAQKSACRVNEGGPFQLTSARVYLNKVTDSKGKADERPNHLRNAVKVLTENGEKIGNQPGRHMLLSKALFHWTQQPGIAALPTRGSLGYTTDPNKPQDLYAALDTSFRFIETAAPECADSLKIFRRMLGIRTLNEGIALISANQLDSARKLVDRSLVIYPGSVSAYNALVVIAGRQGDTTAIASNSRRILEASQGDTTASVKKIRQSAMYNMAIHLIGQAEHGSPNKTEQMAEARRLLQMYIAEVPGDPNAQQALARIASASGDTTSVAAIYADMVANPTRFTDIQLFEAASAMASAKKYDVSAKLYEAGLKSNPYYRDALFNLATVYFEQKDYQRMLPVAQRLTQVDPSNPDSWRQLAAANQGLMRDTKDAKLKKAYQDTLLKYLGKSDSLPVRVAFSEFRHAGAKHTLRGTIENRGQKAGNYTLKVEFIDRNGGVVATEQTTVGPVAPKSSAPFMVQTDKTGIVAFRYAPIT